MQPIEGAYVLAGFLESVKGLGVNTTRCRKTEGMYTGADGEYRFRIERLDNMSPMVTSAIKHGYRSGGEKKVDDELWRSNRPEKYVGRDVYLVRQDPDKPDFFLLGAYGGTDFCYTARSTRDAAAGARFLEIQRDEMIFYGDGKRRIENINEMIRSVKSIDEARAGEIPRK